MQRQKTNDTMFLECNLLKNRLLRLYQILENKASDLKTNGNECAKCCEVAATIAIDVLKMESESLRAVTEIISKNNNNTNKGQRYLNNLQSKNDESNIKEYNPNRKF